MTGPRKVAARPGEDSGITLVEVLVAMSLTSVLMAVFTAGVVQLYRSTNHTEAAAVAQSQLHIAFQRLDTEIRYAAAISPEGRVGGDWYVEYSTTHTGSTVCTQLRLTADRRLQQRRWTAEQADEATSQPFSTLVSGVAGDHPFTSAGAGLDGYQYDRLTVSLSATGGRDAGTRQIDVTFAALNSSADLDGSGEPSSETVCSEGRPTS